MLMFFNHSVLLGSVGSMDANSNVPVTQELLSAKRTKEGLRQGASVFICRDWQAKVKTFLLPSAFLHSDIDIFTLCRSLLGKPESDCKLAKSTGCKVWGAFFFFF